MSARIIAEQSVQCAYMPQSIVKLSAPNVKKSVGENIRINRIYMKPIKKYEMDESLSWEERYRQLEAHHKEETELLMAEVAELRELVVNLELTLEDEENSIRSWDEYHSDDKPYILGGD